MSLQQVDNVDQHSEDALTDLPVFDVVVTSAAAAATSDNNNNNNDAGVSGVGGNRDELFRWQRDPYAATPHSKYARYELAVDHEAGDRAMELRLCSWKRPHMRGFHCAWISFFFSFLIWFAVAPLLGEIQTTLGLSNQQLWDSSITNDVTAIVMRVIVGPICDAYGARIPAAVVLVVAAVPTAAVGLIESGAGLSLCRFFIGIAGSSFVMAQFWPSRMFSREIAGTANGLVGGWGNMGGAVAQIFVGSFLFPLFRDRVYDGNAEKSWRTICVIPAAVAAAWGLVVASISDDAPMGNYKDMRHAGTMDRFFFTTALRSGAKLNTYILCVQYACCFGVELVMNNASVLYFSSEFGLSTEDASLLGFIYVSMNLFARALGGYFSDQLNLKSGLRGRLWLQSILLLLQGVAILSFAFANTLPGAIATICVFFFFTKAAEGAIFGVVPYVSKLYTGSVSGLVGAGGNVGSVVFGLGFRSMEYRDAFIMMGSIAMASSILSAWIRIPCHAGMLSGEDNHAVVKARERYMRRRDRDFLNSSVQEFSSSGTTRPTVASAATAALPTSSGYNGDLEMTQVPSVEGAGDDTVQAAAASSADVEAIGVGGFDR